MAQTHATPHIGTLNENPLHADLKAWYARPGDRLEVPVEGYVVDIVRADLLIEIQTAGFSAIKGKLLQLIAGHRLRLVYPIAREKWLVKVAAEGQNLSRRKSPKRGRLDEVFYELVSFPGLLAEPNFALEVLLIQEEELRRYDPQRAWRRRGWVIDERRLLEVVDSHLFERPQDLAHLLPAELAEPFDTADLAAGLGRPRALAQKMAYCLREMGILLPVGKRGNAILYERAPAPPA
jgi:hypothetical protein